MKLLATGVLREAKHEFEEARKLACQKFILDKTNTVNTAQSCKFWKEFNRLFIASTLYQDNPLEKRSNVWSTQAIGNWVVFELRPSADS